MRTQKSPKASSIVNPVQAPAQAESEVTGNPSAVQPSGAVAAPTTSPSESVSVTDAVGSYQSAAGSANTALIAALPDEPPAGTKKPRRMTPAQRQAAPILGRILLKYPHLSAIYTSEAITDPLSDAEAAGGLEQEFVSLKAKANYAIRLRESAGWRVASVIYSAAVKAAEQDPDLTRDIAPVQALLATGPRERTTAVGATLAAQDATKATSRAGKSRQKAVAKAADAAALQSGTGDAIITTPAPAVTPSNK